MLILSIPFLIKIASDIDLIPPAKHTGIEISLLIKFLSKLFELIQVCLYLPEAIDLLLCFRKL